MEQLAELQVVPSEDVGRLELGPLCRVPDHGVDIPGAEDRCTREEEKQSYSDHALPGGKLVAVLILQLLELSAPPVYPVLVVCSRRGTRHFPPSCWAPELDEEDLTAWLKI